MKQQRKTLLISVIMMTFGIVAVIVCVGRFIKLSNSPKGGEGMFEKNSQYISLYNQDEFVRDIKDDERQKLIEFLKNNNWDISGNKKRDDSYTIVLDFNNDICKLYLRDEDRTCYLKNENEQYELSEEVHELILQYLSE